MWANIHFFVPDIHKKATDIQEIQDFHTRRFGFFFIDVEFFHLFIC